MHPERFVKREAASARSAASLSPLEDLVMSKLSLNRQPIGTAKGCETQKKTALLVVALLAAAVPGFTGVASAKPTYVTFDAPGALYGTRPGAISGGNVTGNYEDASSIHGFLRTPDGSIAAFDPIGSTSTYPAAINSSAEIVGSFNASGASTGFIRTPDGTITNLPVGQHPYGINDKGYVVGADFVSNRGFVINRKGKTKTFRAHGSDPTTAYAIDADGNIAGGYLDKSYLQHGFERLANGNIADFDVAHAVQTKASSIADGMIAGSYEDDNDIYHGFVRSPNGEIATFDVPNSTSTNAFGIDKKGYVTGAYTDAGGYSHGFIRSPNGKVTTFDAPGAVATFADGIDSSQSVAGSCVDSSEGVHGFVRTK
jgi:hypothetical protein